MEKNEETQFSKLMIDGTPEERAVLRETFIQKIIDETKADNEPNVKLNDAIRRIVNNVMIESFTVAVDHYQAVIDELRKRYAEASKIEEANSLRLAKLELATASKNDFN